MKAAPLEPTRHPFVIVLAAIIFAESALLTAATVYLVVEILTATPESYASAIALLVLVAATAVWLAIVGVNLLRGRSWVRGAIITWQILQIAVAIGCFQGLFARPDIGWLLLLPAVGAILLLFARPVVVATARREG